jgi:hypothetical protein
MFGHAPLWGTTDSIFVPTSLKKTDLQPLLTKDLDFTAQNFTAEDEHPVVFMFNSQKIRLFFPFLVMNYYEMIPLIPYVHFKKNPLISYQTSPILYVSSLMIIIGARIVWHLNKVLGTFNLSIPMDKFSEVKYMKEEVFSKHIFNAKENAKAIKMEATADGEVGSIEKFPNFEKLWPLFNTNALIYNNDVNPKYLIAPYIMTVASLQGVTAKIAVDNITGLPPMKFETESINTNVLGSFWVSFEWDLWMTKTYDPTASVV